MLCFEHPGLFEIIVDEIIAQSPYKTWEALGKVRAIPSL